MILRDNRRMFAVSGFRKGNDDARATGKVVVGGVHDARDTAPDEGGRGGR